MAEDVLNHLTKEHRETEGLLDQLAESEVGSERSSLLEELVASLTTHMEVEERFIYPILSEDLDEKEEEEEGDNEHNLIRKGLEQAQQLVDEPGFGAAIEGLRATVSHHVEDEEGEMFPELRAKASDRLAALPDHEVLEQQVKLGRQTKSALLDQAREKDLAGRSGMSKEELEQKLADQG